MPQACFMLLGILLHVSMPAMQGLSDDQCLVNNLDISTFTFLKIEVEPHYYLPGG